MKRPKSGVWAAILSTAILLVPAAHARQQSEKKQGPEQASQQNEKKRQKELASPYKKWLDQEVPYIITDEERTAFLHLSTNEEREQFIEQFWLRRDPTPDTIENEFREEHYRRIAYTNERFTVGAPGWMTDRGRIYILHGAPDQIDSHPTGGLYNEGPREGTRMVTVYAYEHLTYRYLEDFGSNITLEFVDKNSTGDYHLAADPTEKEIFTSPGALTRATDPQSCFSSDKQFQMMDRFKLYANVQRPPELKFKDLEAVVETRLVRGVLPVNIRTDFIRVTEEADLVPITLSILRKDLSFQVKEGIHFAQANVYGRITTPGGRVVQVFEDTIESQIPESLLQQSLREAVVYQKAVPLRPGLYKLVLVVKDVNSGNIGLLERRLAVPRFESDELSHSTLILADLIELAPIKNIGMGQFVIGSTKVRPVVSREFRQDQRLGIYMQVYNLTLNQATHKPDATIRYTLVRGGETLSSVTENAAQFGIASQQLTVSKFLPLASLTPGEYVLVISVTDRAQGQSIQTTANFRVIR